MTNLSIISNENFIVSNDTVRTTSLKVADAFGKNHFHVLRKLESLECSDKFTASNFGLSEYTDSTGRKLPMWEMTKDGFMFLVMGFTGKKAAKVKEAYINAFNMMLDKLYVTAPTTLTPAHQRALQEAVGQRVGNNRALFPKVWGAIKSHFRVGTYKDLPDASFDLALSFVQTFELAALPAPVDPLKAISIKARTHARDAANDLRRFGEGYKDPKAIYDGSRILDQEDMEILRRAKRAIADLEDAVFFRGSRLC